MRRDGVTIAAMVTAKDITEQKQSADLIHERERSMNEAQQVARLGSWSWDIDTDKLAWSAEMCRIFDMDGHRPRALGTSSIFERVHADDRDIISAAFLRGLDGEGSHGPVEFRIVHRDGTELWATAEASAEFDDNGLVTRAFGTVQDITARKHMELDLEARMVRAAAIAELGQRALTEHEPRSLLDEAVALVARTLKVDFANVLELYPEWGELRVLTAAGQEGAAKALDITHSAGFTGRLHHPVQRAGDR